LSLRASMSACRRLAPAATESATASKASESYEDGKRKAPGVDEPEGAKTLGAAGAPVVAAVLVDVVGARPRAPRSAWAGKGYIGREGVGVGEEIGEVGGEVGAGVGTTAGPGGGAGAVGGIASRCSFAVTAAVAVVAAGSATGGCRG
jgi:hypothetical protein